MADEKIKLIIETILADKKFKKGVMSMSKGLKTAGASAGRLKKVLGTVAKSFAVIGAAAVAGIGAFIKSSVDAASAFEEANSKFETVFRGVVTEADKMRQGLVEAYGLSKIESTKFLSSVQDLFVPLGFARDAAAQMSNEVVKLATDLGSFNDLPTENVMLDIQSALVGNFETMKKYGVVLNETVIKAEALARGMTLVKGQVSAQDKAFIALTKIQEGSADAMGDAIRTAGSYANVIKRLKAQFSDLKVELGTGLIPMMAGFAKTAMEAVGGLNELVKAFKTGTLAARQQMDWIFSGAKAYTKIKVETTAWAEELIKAEKNLKRLRATQSRWTGESREATLQVRAIKKEIEKWIEVNELGFASAADFAKAYRAQIEKLEKAQKDAASEAKARAETEKAMALEAAEAAIGAEKLSAAEVKSIRKELRDTAKAQREGDIEEDIAHKEALLETLTEHKEQLFEKETEYAEAMRVIQEELNTLYFESLEARIEGLNQFVSVAGDIGASLTKIEETRLKQQEKNAADNFDKNSALGKAFRAQEAKEEKAAFDAMNAEEQKAFLLKKEYEEGKAKAVADATESSRTRLKQLATFARNVAIVGAIADAAAAVLKTMAAIPYPANIPLAAAQSIAGAAKVSAIKSTPLPQYHEGTESVERDTVARLQRKERIIPADLNISGISNRALMNSAIRGLEMPSMDRQMRETVNNNQQTNESTTNNTFEVIGGSDAMDDMLSAADRMNAPMLRR